MSQTIEHKIHLKHKRKNVIICISCSVFIFSWVMLNIFVMQKEFSKTENKIYNAISSKRSLVSQKAQKTKKSAGFVILGMHRSGTSMLAGLLVRGCGYIIGDNIMEAKPDNPKGFFERWDIVNQNDKWFQHQEMNWNSDAVLWDFDPIKTFEFIGDDVEKHLSPGQRSLNFMNDPKNSPWLVKDPRLCITLTVWLELLKESPAILFTYRHPMEVARSIVSREISESQKTEEKKNRLMVKSLRLWIIYNQKAIENSNHLCRVITYHGTLINDPLREINRISQELTTKCKIPAAPKSIQQKAVDFFFDKGLIHNNEKLSENSSSCMMEYKNADNDTKQLKHYKDAIQVYCDLKNGKAYDSHYKWPDLSVPPSERERVPVKKQMHNNNKIKHQTNTFTNQGIELYTSRQIRKNQFHLNELNRDQVHKKIRNMKHRRLQMHS